MRKKEYTGQRFGRLLVVAPAEPYISPKGAKYTRWLCQCDCGNFKIVAIGHLTRGTTKSCGCLRHEKSSENVKKCVKPGEQYPRQTHGMSKSRLYRIYFSMRNRCYRHDNTSYANYGVRGITVCDEWLHSFEAFRDWALANGYRDDLSIDRIDSNGNYEPSNCRWVPLEEQPKNRRPASEWNRNKNKTKSTG